MDMKEIVITAESKERAIAKALELLGVDEEDIEIEEEEVGELISDKVDFEEKHFRVKVLTGKIAKESENMLRILIERIGLVPEITSTVKDNIIHLKVNTDDNALLIGRKGKNLDAIQHILNRMVFKSKNGVKSPIILLDTENYYDKKIKKLESVASRNAKKALKLKRDVALSPMEPEERKIVHTILRDFEGIHTFSIGVDNGRHIVISPLDKI